MKKVKFKEDHGCFNRGMQYPAEKFSQEKLNELQNLGIIEIYPKIDPEPTEEKPEIKAEQKKGSKRITPGE